MSQASVAEGDLTTLAPDDEILPPTHLDRSRGDQVWRCLRISPQELAEIGALKCWAAIIAQLLCNFASCRIRVDNAQLVRAMIAEALSKQATGMEVRWREGVSANNQPFTGSELSACFLPNRPENRIIVVGFVKDGRNK
jgi:hypothetical protein